MHSCLWCRTAVLEMQKITFYSSERLHNMVVMPMCCRSRKANTRKIRLSSLLSSKYMRK